MKFKRTPQFQEDFDRLSKVDQSAVVEAFPNVVKALNGDIEWFHHFRIKKMQGWERIWEGHVKGDNLCFTFHYEQTKSGDKACFFRRVGTHAIYKKP